MSKPSYVYPDGSPPDERPLTWDEKKAVWRGEDHREPWRQQRAKRDELVHSKAPEIDLDDPISLVEKSEDILWVSDKKKRKRRRSNGKE